VFLCLWVNILVYYYNRSTIRDPSGQITSFGAKVSIGNGLKPIYQRTAPRVALYPLEDHISSIPTFRAPMF